MKRSKILALLLAMCMVFAMLASCSNSDAGDTGDTGASTPSGTDAVGGGSTVSDDTAYVRQTEEGTLTIGTTTNTDTFNPVSSFNAIGMQLVYDQLFVQNPETGEIEGQLAESWEYQDSTHLYIKIHEGATFSNGDPITTTDALWSLQRIVTEESRWSTFVDAIDFDSCQIISDTEMVIAYFTEFGPGLNYLATRYSSVLCKAYVESTDEDAFWDAPVSSGPYTLVENVSGSYSTYQLRDDYWGEMPEASFITVKNYAEATTMFIDYENGVLDAAFSVDSSDAERLISGAVADTNYAIAPGYDVYGLALPEYVSYFDDIRVRQAIAYAIDAAAVAEIGLGVLGGEATSILPEGVNYKIDCGTYEYNPEKAVELLTEAGYASGDIVLRFVVVNFPSNVRIAEAVQAYLAAVGITVNVESYDLATAVPIFMAAETDLVINSMGASALDPDQQLDTVKATSTNATVRVTDELMAGYLQTGRDSVDTAVRQEAYENAQNWMYENIRQVTLCEVFYCYCYRPYITSLATVSVQYPNLRMVHFG